MTGTKGNEDLQLIDVEKVFASKNANLARKLPRFIIRYLKRIVHQDEINDFLIRNRGIEGLEFLERIVEFMDVRVEVRGLENVPRDGRLIFASNHPLGGVDGLFLLKTIAQEIRPHPRSVSNDLLMNIRPLREFMIGVNKHGGNAKENVAEMLRAFEGDNPIVFFASGLVSRRRWFKIEDLEWKSTFVKKAFLHERDVIPVFITGRVSGFFYSLANLRKFLHIKSNIEMLYLPNEMFKQKGMKVIIQFGEPIRWKTFDSSRSPEQWAAHVKKVVYQMGRNLRKNS
ncbi:MAG: 1-acyl-sn-glycerol-3-phosphate acyltransferase [Bacteroidota bacterium]